MLCVAATESIGYDVLDVNLRIASDVARDHGRTMSPSAVRLVGPMHVAETREQAFRDVERGLPQFLDYFRRVNPAASANAASAASPAEALVASGRAVIGTPEDAVAQIRRLQEKCGAFGSFLLLAHNWASWERTKLSYELIARRVAPVLQDSNAMRTRSLAEYTENNQALTASVAQAARATIAEHRADVEKALRGSKTPGGERSDAE
jgi:limonene 1,2-monooxygenase